MAELRSQDKRDKLRLLYAQCKPNGKSLEGLLMDALKVCDEAISDGGSAPGTWLSSTSENGGSVGFSMLAGFSPIVAKRLIGEMLDAHDAAADDLEDSTGTEPNDEAIFTYMMRHSFRSVRKFRTDFTGGRYGTSYYLGT